MLSDFVSEVVKPFLDCFPWLRTLHTLSKWADWGMSSPETRLKLQAIIIEMPKSLVPELGLHL